MKWVQEDKTVEWNESEQRTLLWIKATYSMSEREQQATPRGVDTALALTLLGSLIDVKCRDAQSRRHVYCTSKSNIKIAHVSLTLT